MWAGTTPRGIQYPGLAAGAFFRSVGAKSPDTARLVLLCDPRVTEEDAIDLLATGGTLVSHDGAKRRIKKTGDCVTG